MAYAKVDDGFDYLPAMDIEVSQTLQCLYLVDMPKQVVDRYISYRDPGGFDNFCHLPKGQDCSYYNILFLRYGALVKSSEAGFCRFIPRVWIEGEVGAVKGMG